MTALFEGRDARMIRALADPPPLPERRVLTQFVHAFQRLVTSASMRTRATDTCITNHRLHTASNWTPAGQPEATGLDIDHAGRTSPGGWSGKIGVGTRVYGSGHDRRRY